MSVVLPECGEFLWADMLLEASEFTCLVALFETCFVLFLAYYTEETLLPSWLIGLLGMCCSGAKKDQDIEDLERLMEDKNESPAGILYRERKNIASGSVKLSVTSEEAQPPQAPLDRERLMVYESLFFKMDEGGSGIVDNDEMKRFLAFANLEMDAAARDAALTKADVTGDGKMVRWEFVVLCINVLDKVPLEELKLAADNYMAAASCDDRKNEARWKAAAKSLDMYARIALPLAYLTFVVIHYNTEYTDYYNTEPTRPMFVDFGPSTMTIAGVGYSLIVPAIFIIGVFSWLQTRCIAKQVNLLDSSPNSAAALLKKKNVLASSPDGTSVRSNSMSPSKSRLSFRTNAVPSTPGVTDVVASTA